MKASGNFVLDILLQGGWWQAELVLVLAAAAAGSAGSAVVGDVWEKVDVLVYALLVGGWGFSGELGEERRDLLEEPSVPLGRGSATMEEDEITVEGITATTFLVLVYLSDLAVFSATWFWRMTISPQPRWSSFLGRTKSLSSMLLDGNAG